MSGAQAASARDVTVAPSVPGGQRHVGALLHECLPFWPIQGALEGPAASPVDYCPLWLLMASSTFFLIASRLNEAGSCIGG